MTPQQDKLYRYLLERIDDNICPSYEQMMAHMGLKAKSGIARIVDALKEQGLVTSIPNRQQTTRAVRPANFIQKIPDVDFLMEAQRRGWTVTRDIPLYERSK